MSGNSSIIASRERERERVVSELTSPLVAQESWKLQVVLHRDIMPESANISWKEPVYVKAQCGELECFADIASTLMARDYKGAGNQRFNGVLEC